MFSLKKKFLKGEKKFSTALISIPNYVILVLLKPTFRSQSQSN